MIRGEQKSLFELIRTIATSQGLKGFWQGNFVNVLRTAPFKAVNFYAYDTYRNRLMKITGNEETTNFERFLAGATAGITATVLCIPMDTVSNEFFLFHLNEFSFLSYGIRLFFLLNIDSKMVNVLKMITTRVITIMYSCLTTLYFCSCFMTIYSEQFML